MSGPVCKQCGSTDVAWRAGKNGGRYLIDTKRPHFCAKMARPKPSAEGPRAEAVQALVALGYKATEARGMVKAARGEDVEALVRDALRRTEAPELGAS